MSIRDAARFHDSLFLYKTMHATKLDRKRCILSTCIYSGITPSVARASCVLETISGSTIINED